MFYKHYKKLNDIFFSRRSAYPVTNSNKGQLIHISVLTIDTINHQNFPNIIEVDFLQNSKKSKKATGIFRGKTKISTKCVHLLNTLFCFPSKTVLNLHNDGTNSVGTFIQESRKALGKEKTKENELKTHFKMVDKMVGAGIDMYHYKVRLSKGGFGFTTAEGQGVKEVKTTKGPIMLSKAELSSTIIQIIYKVHFSKGGKQIHLNANLLSSIVGAFVVINSSIYYISDYELKQCGLVGNFKQFPVASLSRYSISTKSSLLKKLLAIKIEDKKPILGTQTLKPNIAIFNFLQMSVSIGIFRDCKKILRQLLNILVKNSIVKK